MNSSVLLVALASFVAGLLVASRLTSWIAFFLSTRKSRSDGRTGWSGFEVAPLLLHSGPWALAIAAAGIYYTATSSRPEVLWAAVGGMAVAAGVLASAVVFGLWRRGRLRRRAKPLTPERFLTKRRRFFWLNSLCSALFVPIFVNYTSPAMSRENSQLLFLFVGLIAFVSGWLGSWFLWQWYGEVLKLNEKTRQLKERTQ